MFLGVKICGTRWKKLLWEKCAKNRTNAASCFSLDGTRLVGGHQGICRALVLHRTTWAVHITDLCGAFATVASNSLRFLCWYYYSLCSYLKGNLLDMNTRSTRNNQAAALMPCLSCLISRKSMLSFIPPDLGIAPTNISNSSRLSLYYKTSHLLLFWLPSPTP